MWGRGYSDRDVAVDGREDGMGELGRSENVMCFIVEETSVLDTERGQRDVVSRESVRCSDGLVAVAVTVTVTVAG